MVLKANARSFATPTTKYAKYFLAVFIRVIFYILVHQKDMLYFRLKTNGNNLMSKFENNNAIITFTEDALR